MKIFAKSRTISLITGLVIFTMLLPGTVSAYRTSSVAAAFISDTIPATMTASQSYIVSVTMKNTGILAWNETSGIRLGGVGDLSGDAAEFGSTRIPIPSGTSVLPGSQHTFTFTMTAPSTPGNYTPKYRMIWDGHRWFGARVVQTVQVISKSSVSTGIPTAQFTANITEGQAPLTVKFTDNSVSTGTTTYNWDIINDGTTDYTTKNPSHTYTAAGNYTVNLTVTNASGSDNEIKSRYITVTSLEGVSDPSSPIVPAGSSTLYLDQFGIKADGSDETSALQAAFNYAVTSGKTVVAFPAGKTIGLKAGTIRFPDGITYIGNGCTLKRLDTAGGHPVFIKMGASSGGSGLDVSGLIFNLNSFNIYSGGDGIMLNDNVYFHNNEVKNGREYSVEVYGSDNVRIENNKVHDSYQYGIVTGGGDAGGTSSGVKVKNNYVFGCMEVGIKIRGTNNAVISGNTVDTSLSVNGGDHESTIAGIRLYSDDYSNSNIAITGNTVYGSSSGWHADGISSDTGYSNTGITITGNTVHGVATGMNLPNLSGTVVVTGNTITNSGTYITPSRYLSGNTYG